MGRVTAAKTHYALDFMWQLLDQSNEFDLLERDPVSFRLQKRDERKRVVDIVIANRLGSDLYKAHDVFRSRFMENQADRVYTCPILYEDGTSAFVRVVDTENLWRNNRELLHRAGNKRPKVHKMRNIEKVVMATSSDLKTIQYFHRKSARIDDCIRTFRMVELPSPSPTSRDWRFAENTQEECYRRATINFGEEDYIAGFLATGLQQEAKQLEFQQ